MLRYLNPPGLGLAVLGCISLVACVSKKDGISQGSAPGVHAASQVSQPMNRSSDGRGKASVQHFDPSAGFTALFEKDGAQPLALGQEFAEAIGPRAQHLCFWLAGQSPAVPAGSAVLNQAWQGEDGAPKSMGSEAATNPFPTLASAAAACGELARSNSSPDFVFHTANLTAPMEIFSHGSLRLPEGDRRENLEFSGIAVVPSHFPGMEKGNVLLLRFDNETRTDVIEFLAVGRVNYDPHSGKATLVDLCTGPYDPDCTLVLNEETAQIMEIRPRARFVAGEAWMQKTVIKAGN